MMTRCCCADDSSLLAQLEKQAVVDLNPENTKALRDILQVQIESAEECAICEYRVEVNPPVLC